MFGYNLYVSPNIISVDQIKDNEMGWACGMCGEEEKCIQDLCGAT
jgi:hypothetical protein